MTASTSDYEIREAMHRKLLKQHHQCEKTLVVDELGLAHGRSRVDIAVLNGWVHGYEIKSSKDTTRRLDGQLTIYRKCLEKLTIISAENHIQDIYRYCPDYVGLIVVYRGKRGGLHFEILRKAMTNPEIDPFLFAHLLWKEEALRLTRELNLPKFKASDSKETLYKKLSETLTVRQLSRHINKAIMNRDSWRDPQQLVSYDGSTPLPSI